MFKIKFNIAVCYIRTKLNESDQKLQNLYPINYRTAKRDERRHK